MDPATHAYPALQSPVHVDVVRPLEDPCRPESQGPLQLALDMVAVAPYRPVLQLVHTLAPARLYLPAGHTITVALVEAAGQAYPAAHDPLQLALDMAAVAPYRPVLQLVHTAAPAKLYRPAGQAAAVALVDPATHAYPALQSPVHVEETCPVLAP